jgi:hypothetical protein
MENKTIVDFKSTIDSILEFTKGTIWSDMKSELSAWMKDVQEIQDSTGDEKELFRCQGRKEAVNNFLALPEIIIDFLEQKNGK